MADPPHVLGHATPWGVYIVTYKPLLLGEPLGDSERRGAATRAGPLLGQLVRENSQGAQTRAHLQLNPASSLASISGPTLLPLPPSPRELSLKSLEEESKET